MVNLYARIDKLTSPEPMSGCWLWSGVTDVGGYAMVWTHPARKIARVHRINYERFKGPIPPGFLVLHSCDVRCCINPQHLSVGTAKQNTMDMYSRGRNRVVKGKSRKGIPLGKKRSRTGQELADWLNHLLIGTATGGKI